MLHFKKMGGSLPFLISLEFLKISAKLLFSIKHYKNWKYFSKKLRQETTKSDTCTSKFLDTSGGVKVGVPLSP